VSTLERWFYKYKSGGLEALRPTGRADRGRARQLDVALRKLLCEIRREHPTASAALIVRTLVREGVLAAGVLTAVTLRRFYQEQGLPKGERDKAGAAVRLRWQAARPHALWHGDVCHGPTLVHGGQRVPLRIHGMLDDRSRAVIALEPLSSERESDMLQVFVRALLLHGKPDALYLDNGPTYCGDALRLACERLGITLIHAQPYDPEARGKMERLWRTMREQCLDFISPTSALHEVRAQLLAWVEDYHRNSHAGLLGDRPARVLATGAANAVSEAEIRDALTVVERRRVRNDSTLSIGGKLYQVTEHFLGKRIVTVRFCLLDQRPDPWVELQGRRYRLDPVDVVGNASTRRTKEPKTSGPAVSFEPNRARLNELVAQIRSNADEKEDLS
jgi:transposase InsO family protein